MKLWVQMNQLVWDSMMVGSRGFEHPWTSEPSDIVLNKVHEKK